MTPSKAPHPQCAARREDVNKVALWLLLTGAGCILAVGVGTAVFVVVNALLPPFRFEDGDTMREYGRVALTYASMG
jgi:hypothetical protein